MSHPEALVSPLMETNFMDHNNIQDFMDEMESPAAVVAASDDDLAVPGGADGPLSCTPYERTIGAGERAVRICPILNGIWTSFLDERKWGRPDKALAPPLAAAVAREMRLYDAVGLDTWIGEDFDERAVEFLLSVSPPVAEVTK